MKAVSNLISLQELHLQGCSQLPQIESVTRLTRLKILDLTGCSNVHDLTPLMGLTLLEELCLYGCTALQAPEFLKLSHLTVLRRLDVGGRQERGGSFSLTFVSNLPDSLQSLALADCYELHDFKALNSKPNLTFLDLGSYRGLDSETFRVIGTLTSLESLLLFPKRREDEPEDFNIPYYQIDWLDPIREYDLEMLYGLTALRYLVIAECEYTLEAIKRLSDNLPDLWPDRNDIGRRLRNPTYMTLGGPFSPDDDRWFSSSD